MIVREGNTLYKALKCLADVFERDIAGLAGRKPKSDIFPLLIYCLLTIPKESPLKVFYKLLQYAFTRHAVSGEPLSR